MTIDIKLKERLFNTILSMLKTACVKNNLFVLRDTVQEN